MTRLKLLMSAQAEEDLAYWKRYDQAIAGRVCLLLKNLEQDHAFPTHQATQLKFMELNLFSIRIAKEHRLVVQPLGDQLIVHQCRFHY